MPTDMQSVPKPQPMDKKPVKDEPASEPEQPPKPPLLRFWHFIRPILILIVVLFAIRSSVVDWNDVPTGSMMPTILDGDRIVVNKLAYDLKVPFTTIHLATWSDPKRGDILVFFSPDDGIRLVKRCVAVPGDTVLLVDNQLFINGVKATYGPLDPKYANNFSPSEQARYSFALETYGGKSHPIMTMPYNFNPKRSFGPITVPQGKYFMMGDSRDNSKDSRFFRDTFVPRDQIVGRATAIALSVDLNHHWLPRWARFFSSLP